MMHLQNKHAAGEVVRVRPSQLCLTARGTVVTAPCSQRAADVEDKLYASPEELLNKPMSAASDIYSLVSGQCPNVRVWVRVSWLKELLNKPMTAASNICSLVQIMRCYLKCHRFSIKGIAWCSFQIGDERRS